jgi:hypothetical protein
MPRSITQFALLLAAAVAADAAAQVRPINDTGQIICYNNTASTGTVTAGTLDPEAAGFNRQDCTLGAAAADALGAMPKLGGSTVPGRDYTKIANDGSVLPASATLGPNPGDWGCTRDNVTGLVWEIKTTSGLRSQSHTYSWFDSNNAVNGNNPGSPGDSTSCGGTLANCNTTAYRNAVNALIGPNRLCGATDWRLPNTFELRGLVHLGAVSGPRIDPTWFPNTPSTAPNGDFWTGVNFAANENGAWFVCFGDGDLTTQQKGIRQAVRLVRSEP